MKYFFILLFCSSFWLSKAADSTYPVPLYTEVCVGDTIFIPVYINAINNYESVHAFIFESVYLEEYYDYIGINTSQTVVPIDDLVVTFPYYTNFEYVRIEADLGDQTFYELDRDASVLVTLMFIAKQEYENMSPSVLYTDYTDAYGDLLTDYTYTSIRKFITIHDNPTLEISDSLTEYQNYLTISATGGLENYEWSYEKEYNTDYAFDDISYSDSMASFIGNGKYTLWATDEIGCSSSAEIYIENDGVFAKGRVTAQGELFTDGTVSAYIKNYESFSLTAQTTIKDNGEYIFPGTLEKGEYVFIAEPNENDKFQATYYGDKPNIEDAFVLNLTDADGVVDLNIDLSREDNSINSEANKTVYTKTINSDFKIYPNPVTNTLYIEAINNINESKTNITIYSISGDVIYQNTSSKTTETIDVTLFKRGVYFVATNNAVTRIIKE